MKAHTVTVILSLVGAGCHSSSVHAEQIVVTTPTGRKQSVTKQYTIQEIEVGMAATNAPFNPFDIHHPVFPQKEDITELKQRLKQRDKIWYFRGPDSGWAIVRDAQVVWVLVTNHEY